MARADRDTFKKRIESDMRQFGDQVTNWTDTHSQIADEAQPLAERWKDLGKRLGSIHEVPEDEWDAFAMGLSKDLAQLKSDYQRASSKYDIRH